MRQLQAKPHELTLRCVDVGHHGLSHGLILWGRLGVLLLLVGLWLGPLQTPLPAMMMTVLGSVLIVIRQFVPRLYPEVATCTFNKAMNRLTVTHEIADRRGRAKFRDRNIVHYAISDIQHISVYRQRKRWFSAAYTLLIELGRQTGRRDMISIDSLHDQVMVQRGNATIQRLAKAVDYQLGHRIKVSWTYVTVADSINPQQLGQRLAIKSLRRRPRRLNMPQIAATVEQFLRTP